MHRFGLTILAGAVGAALLLGAVGSPPRSALATSGPNAAGLGQFIYGEYPSYGGYGSGYSQYPYSWGQPYSTYYTGQPSAAAFGLPSYSDGYSRGYYTYGDPYAGSPGYPYYQYGSHYGYGWGVPGYVRR